MKGGMIQVLGMFNVGRNFLDRAMNHRGHSRQSGQKQTAKREHTRAMRRQANSEIQAQLDDWEEDQKDDSEAEKEYWDDMFESQIVREYSRGVYVQYCPCGCVIHTDDPEMIRKSREREAKGYLDALTLSTDDCPQCMEQRHWDELYDSMHPW